MPKKKITIIIPVFNEKKFIDKIIKKVKKDLHFNKQIIVVDDCSSDGTRKIIKNNKNIRFRKLLLKKDVSKISVIGVGMITTPGVTFRMFQSLADKKINIQVISTSEIKISVLIDKKNMKKALIALHKEFKLDNEKWASDPIEILKEEKLKKLM